MNLLLLASTFPYNPGEPFLDGEIGVLAATFDNVLIVPLDYHQPIKRECPRPLPENVNVFLLPEEAPTHYWFQRIPKEEGILGASFRILQAAIHGRIFLPQQLHGLCSQYLNAAVRSSFLCHNVNLDHYDIFYSYWGADKGLCLNILKKQMEFSDKKVFVSRVHGYDIYAERFALKRLPFQKTLLKTCDITAPCSEQGERYLQERYPQLSQNVKHFHLGVPGQMVLNTGSADDVLRIVTCSHIEPVKRLWLLISALTTVERNVIWTHIGAGREEEMIHKLAEHLPPNINAVFLGQLGHEAVIEYYRNNKVDLFINVSSYEGIPVSIMEALSFGIEPVATDVGGVAELVKSEFGTLLPPDLLPEQLSFVLQNHKNDRARRIKAQNHQRLNFSLANYQTFAEKLIEVHRRKNDDHP